jgi:membrane protease subunit (stomatin/prohibitin family)
MIQINAFTATITSGEYNYSTLKVYENNSAMKLKEASIIDCYLPAIYAIAVFTLALIIKRMKSSKGFTLHVTHSAGH